ncbi:Phosphatidylinositol N-acetylglucosaminyltransferase subunit gpi15 [Botryosphaeria dothidea]|uniref:Phosphatidylinositol N-acetylglucosaminyltransferase subunit gpi15 n=1 Tax=Botryosphaeria dothidea TaxID=55169 RepID=A0A8H4IUE6_9PEZI|nr:Phosphatidylinositol N-acetylglucosaminyltransferase subunit gpi15 [Botryosphaeria dothidea]KAF4305328.1 Phosphatidylinositol N-acetylglucosaminyltransferase subunit gpi15 [Botryosphaeria dothidea]
MILLSNNAPPKLRVARPTPSTVSFTVSTRPVADTVPKKALLYFSHAIRLGLGVLILALFWAKWRSYFPIRNEDPESWERRLLTNYVGVCVAWAAEGIDWKVLGGVGAVGLWGVLRRGYTVAEESLLVLRGLGVQTSSSSPTYLSTATTRFIPTASIQDIFIHEAFKGFEVRFYLAIVVVGEEDTVVVFPNLLPERQILEEVWRGTRACLYEPKS